MKTIIFVSNKKQFKNLYNYNSSKDEGIIIFSESNLKEEYKKLKIFNKFGAFLYSEVINDYENWEKCLIEANNFYHNWNNLKINKCKIYYELLGYNNISLLDIDASHYLSSHTEIIALIFFKISIIQSIIKKYNPTKVITLFPENDWEKIVRMLCYKENVRIINYGKRLNKIKLYSDRKYFAYKKKIFNKEFNIKIPFNLLPFILKFKKFILFKKINNEVDYINGDNRREIIFFIINRKYLDVIVPVVESIKKDNIFKTLVLIPSNFDALEILKEKNIPFKCIDSFITKDIIKKSKKIYSDILNKYNKIKKHREFKEKMYQYKDLNLEDFFSKEIGKTILFSINNIIYTLLVKKIEIFCKPKVFIATNISGYIARSLMESFKNSNIPVIGIWRGSAGSITECSIFNGNLLLVAGKYSKDNFSKWKTENYKVNITGLPIFDDLLSKLKDKNSIEKEIRNILKIDLKFHIITYLCQIRGARFGNKERLYAIRTIYNSVKKIDNAFLIIKMHPSESDTEIYSNLAEKIGLKRYIVIKNELPLDDLLISSKIAIAINSTSCFNALIAGCKLIICGIQNIDMNKNHFVSSGVALLAKNSEELYFCINKILGESKEDSNINLKIANFLENHFYKIDSKSPERIKKNIYKVIENKT